MDTKSRLLFYGIILIIVMTVSWPIWGSAETAYIVGRQSWFTGADTIQFMGDGDYSDPFSTCESWDEGCFPDGHVFRKVGGVNTSTCSHTTRVDSCYVAGVVCCYWYGSCSEEWQICRRNCELLEEECGKNCYCNSIWRAVSFNAAPGDDSDPEGCYQIELLCDPDDLDCTEGIDYCEEVYYIND